MQLRVKKTDLLAELPLLGRITERKTSIPILQDVLLDADVSLRLAATDLDMSLRSSCDADVVKPGRVGLPARKLTEIVRSLPDGDVEINVDVEFRTTITSARSKFKIPGNNPDDYPKLPEANGHGVISIPSAVLKDLIARTAFAITNEDARYYLAGALMLLEPAAVTMVATDGHRMAYAKRAAEVNVTEAQRLLLPRKTIQEMTKLLPSEGAVSLQELGAHQLYTLGGRVLTSKAIEGTFPAFEKVINAPMPYTLLVERAALEEAVKRVALVASERSRAIRLSLSSSEVVVSASTPDQGEASEAVPAEFDGGELSIGYSAGYVLEFLAATAAEKVTLSCKDGKTQAMFKPADGGDVDYRYVIMPMWL